MFGPANASGGPVADRSAVDSVDSVERGMKIGWLIREFPSNFLALNWIKLGIL